MSWKSDGNIYDLFSNLGESLVFCISVMFFFVHASLTPCGWAWIEQLTACYFLFKYLKKKWPNEPENAKSSFYVMDHKINIQKKG